MKLSLSNLDDCAEIRELPWDTEVLGYTCAQIDYMRCHAAKLWLAQELIDQLTKMKFDHVIARIPDVSTVQLLEHVGFTLLDGWVDWKLEPLSESYNRFVTPTDTWQCGEFTIRPAMPEDEDALCALATRVYAVDRFHTDPHNDARGVDRVYRVWMRNSLHGFAQRVNVATSKELGIMGYSTCRMVGKEHGLVDINGIDVRVQRRGLGTALFKSNIAYLYQQGATCVTVATQLSNAGAIAMHQKLGFKLFDTKFTLCKWLSERKKSRYE